MKAAFQQNKIAPVEFNQKVAVCTRLAQEDIPAKTQRAVLPRLRANVQGEFVFDGEGAYETLNVLIEKFLPSALTDAEFRLVPVGHGFQLFLDGNEMMTRACETPEAAMFASFKGVLGEGEIVNVLDASTTLRYFSPTAKRTWFVLTARRVMTGWRM